MRFTVLLPILALAAEGRQRSPLAGYAVAGRESSEEAVVTISVSTTFGEPVGKTLVVLTSVGTKQQYRQLDKEIKFEHVPFDLYDVEIYGAGFNTRGGRVGIYQSEIRLRFGLVVAPHHAAERSEIAGSVTQQGGGLRDPWVRLVLCYSSDFIQDRVSKTGTFRLSGADPGQYILLVLDGDQLITTRPVKYFGGKL